MLAFIILRTHHKTIIVITDLTCIRIVDTWFNHIIPIW